MLLICECAKLAIPLHASVHLKKNQPPVTDKYTLTQALHSSDTFLLATTQTSHAFCIGLRYGVYRPLQLMDSLYL